MSLQMGYRQGTNQSDWVFALGRQVYDLKPSDRRGSRVSRRPSPRKAPEYPYYQEEVGY